MNFRDTAEGAIRRGAYELLGVADAIDYLYDVPDTPFPLLGRLDDFTDDVRAGLRELLRPGPGEDPYGINPPTITPPGLGVGQCPGVRYDVSYEVDFPLPGDPGNVVAGGLNNLLGPIQGIRVDVAGNTSQVVVEHNGGDSFGIFETNSSQNYENPRFTSIVRADGTPDDCPENVPSPPTVEDPIDYDPPSGPPITINPVIIYNPINVDNNNNLIIPVVFAYANVRITAALNINIGRIVFSPDFNFGDDENCCPEPGTDDPLPPDPDPQPDPPEVTVITGVVVTVTNVTPDAPATQVMNANGPDFYFADLGLVSFRVAIGGTFVWTKPERVNMLRQYIPCPYSPGAASFTTIERNGVSLTVTPIYGTVAQLST